MKVYNKFRNNELPVYMQNWPLITNNEIQQYTTGMTSDLHTFKYHHTYVRTSLRHYPVQTINDTPDNVFSKFGTHSLNGFSNYVKKHCINNYQDGCDIPNCYICSRHTHAVTLARTSSRCTVTHARTHARTHAHRHELIHK